MYATFPQVPLQLQLQEKEDKNFSENDENQDQVLIHLSLLIRMGTWGSPFNNRRLVKTKQERERSREADCEKNKISMADLQEQLSGG